MCRVLCKMRGMTPAARTDDELKLSQWLAKLDRIEEVDEETHDLMARTFLVRALDHDGKRALLSKEHKKPKTKASKKKRSRDDDESDDEEEEEEFVNPGHDYTDAELIALDRTRKVVSLNNKLYTQRAVLSNCEQFLKHLHPMLFMQLNQDTSQLPNPAIDYQWAVLLHAGTRAQNVRKQLTRCVTLVQKLREVAADRQQLDSPTQLKVRIVMVAWGSTYHPVKGLNIKRLRALMHDMSAKAAKEGDGISYEVFSVHELLFDATDHVDVGPVQVVRDMKQYRCLRHTKPHELPYIKRTDIQARLRDLRPGQVVRVERHDFALGGITEEFRYVIDE